MTPTYTENCAQQFFDTWWKKTKNQDLVPGRLVRAFVPHVDQVPTALVAKGRTKATVHSLADCEVISVNSKKLFQKSQTPVAAFPCFNREVRAVYRAKKRPVLILSPPGVDVRDKHFKGKPRRLSSPTVMVAPYYGRDEGTGRRVGFPQPFVERAASCEWPQFFWDKLPLDDPETKESILRLDHLLPMSTHHVAYEPTPWKLSTLATDFMHEYALWYLTGNFSTHKIAELSTIRSALMEV